MLPQGLKPTREKEPVGDKTDRLVAQAASFRNLLLARVKLPKICSPSFLHNFRLQALNPVV